MQVILNVVKSTLMTFFDYNHNNMNGQQYLYHEFSVHYVYIKSLHCWHPQQQEITIDHIYHCNPIVDEKYFLQLLLTIV